MHFVSCLAGHSTSPLDTDEDGDKGGRQDSTHTLSKWRQTRKKVPVRARQKKASATRRREARPGERKQMPIRPTPDVLG
ncbi:hypothetical protein GGTG_04680 [Gaeumannomyces tritici R3-111a-1]|uniref:Uncharacterized protein n=1 Tax=Gaeumannomyces tritici (strain R3-111a-1) TaxID=644352 RepID=J3NTT1_GAET3|nr:hypothetical protein GGTG_04680 [Gaeumannomyces tritici R3-111a-1]EJT79596.1 hypothetical protein GGTG_04680 [Gaeumannomyces tritici R3-111a-1]